MYHQIKINYKLFEKKKIRVSYMHSNKLNINVISNNPIKAAGWFRLRLVQLKIFYNLMSVLMDWKPQSTWNHFPFDCKI